MMNLVVLRQSTKIILGFMAINLKYYNNFEDLIF